MEKFNRFAVYYAPRAGDFAKAASEWLGWDLAVGRAVAQPADLPDLATQTADPRKYGFHGTLKPPFRLATGVSPEDLGFAVQSLARTLPAIAQPGLAFAQLDGFLALTPAGDTADLADLAATVVRALDPLRAPLTPAEIARRRADTLSARQRELLAIYGYPYVMEQFQFHLTLSGRLTNEAVDTLEKAARNHFNGLLPQPFVVADLCLCGEDDAAQFHLLHRYPLMA